MDIQKEQVRGGSYLPTIKIVGVGGAGVNAINSMVEFGLSDVELIAVNTDTQQLVMSDADTKVEIGRALTGGLGVGGDPEIGRQAAEESVEEIEEILRGANMVFITAGEGGGTGTGASPVIARVAKELGCLTVAIVTKPFSFEGSLKMETALDGIEELKKNVDCLITISSDKLLVAGGKNIKFAQAFSMCDETLLNNARAVTEMLTKAGYVNVDFNDVRSTMENAGTAVMGMATAKGEDRAINAVEQAISSPLLESRLDGAKDAIICYYCTEDSFSLTEVQQANTMLQEMIDPRAKFKFGVYYDDLMQDDMRVIVIATKFPENQDAILEDVNDVSDTPDEPVPSQPESEEDALKRKHDQLADFGTSNTFSSTATPHAPTSSLESVSSSLNRTVASGKYDVFDSTAQDFSSPNNESLFSSSRNATPSTSFGSAGVTETSHPQFEDSLELPSFLDD
ncbi:MAG: cell division protein FtsZ [Candidatus Ancillula sp.]|jgi:cell division protein FtsZ|nr:cell division protein FtsZ [Candidatus Ancillula sp.]